MKTKFTLPKPPMRPKGFKPIKPPRADKGERRTLHPQSHDEFMKLGLK